MSALTDRIKAAWENEAKGKEVEPPLWIHHYRGKHLVLKIMSIVGNDDHPVGLTVQSTGGTTLLQDHDYVLPLSALNNRYVLFELQRYVDRHGLKNQDQLVGLLLKIQWPNADQRALGAYNVQVIRP